MVLICATHNIIGTEKEKQKKIQSCVQIRLLFGRDFIFSPQFLICHFPRADDTTAGMDLSSPLQLLCDFG